MDIERLIAEIVADPQVRAEMFKPQAIDALENPLDIYSGIRYTCSMTKKHWKIVSRVEVEKATKARNEKRAKADAAVQALMMLKDGDAICIDFPKDTRSNDYVRTWWRSKMNIASKKEGVVKAFVSITSSDRKSLLVLRKIVETTSTK